jgi:superfamily II DNA/RNA helicase
LISTEAGGEGRNLQFCRTVVNYDLPWNPMRIEQRIGRVHRLGQTRDIRIYNFTARDTVEDYVLAILHRKINMFELVIGEMDMILGQWSEKESFEQRVFQIWASHRNRQDLKDAFGKFGEDMLLARKRYEKIRDYDQKIFETADSKNSVAVE